METIVNALREIIGTPDFYVEGSGSYSSNYWDYAAMFEYFFAGLILCIAICGVFRFILNVVKR